MASEGDSIRFCKFLLEKMAINAQKFVTLPSQSVFVMKKGIIITALAAMMTMAVAPAFAQEENGFKKFNVREDFTENGFQWFHDAELLATRSRAMP